MREPTSAMVEIKSTQRKSKEAGYVATHMWILKHYGKAKMCEKCYRTDASRYEWANISGQYKRDISDYMQLCPSCHRKMDITSAGCRKGHKFTPDNTGYTQKGWRYCKICKRERDRRYKVNARNKIQSVG